MTIFYVRLLFIILCMPFCLCKNRSEKEKRKNLFAALPPQEESKERKSRETEKQNRTGGERSEAAFLLNCKMDRGSIPLAVNVNAYTTNKRQILEHEQL